MSNVFASLHHTCFDKLFFLIPIHQTCDKTPFFDLCHRYEKQMRPSLVPRATKGKKTCAISCFNTFDLYETWCILKSVLYGPGSCTISLPLLSRHNALHCGVHTRWTRMHSTSSLYASPGSSTTQLQKHTLECSSTRLPLAISKR